jgi:apolipoprotein N-acyltransferase
VTPPVAGLPAVAAGAGARRQEALAAALAAAAGVAGSTALLGLYAHGTAPGGGRPFAALGFVALVPWLHALARTRRTGAALGLGWALAVGLCAACLPWFPLALHRYTQAPLALCWALVLGLAPVLQPQLLAAAAVWAGLRRRGAGVALGGAGLALAYVGAEWALPKLLADTLAHGLVGAPLLRQGADVAGAPGLTLLLLLANVAALAALQRLRAGEGRAALRPLALLLAVPLALAAYGRVRLGQVAAAEAGGRAVGVGLVQANLTDYAGLRERLGTYEAVRTILDTHEGLSDGLLAEGARAGAPLDVLVWPETVYPTTFASPRSEEGAELDAELGAFAAGRGVSLVFGTYDVEEGGGAEYNAAALLSAPGGEPSAHLYRKAHPFPLTERVPPWLDTPAVRGALPWLGTWARGEGPEVVGLPLRDGGTLRVAPLICYDALAAGDVAQAAREGAQLLVTLSNDAWFSGTAGPRLHLAAAAFRSVETRLHQVRATTSGVSAWVDATGEVRAAAGDGERAALAVRPVLAVRPLPTLARAWGDWLGPWALGGALALVLAARVRRRPEAG